MKTKVDCLIIGHNEMDFREYEKSVRKMGIDSGAYRDLNLNFIQYQGIPRTASELFNLFSEKISGPAGRWEPIRFGETFSAAVAYLGTFLDRHGLSFDYINAFQEDKAELTDKLQSIDFLCIAVTTTFYVSVLPVLEIVQFVKGYQKNAKIIIGGPFISTQVRSQEPESLAYLFNSVGADFYVNSSQGEAALVQIVKALKNSSSVENIPNIYYRDPGIPGRYAAAPFLRENNRLSENMVKWNLFSGGVGKYVGIRSAISCPFSCAFCGFPEHAGKYQYVEVEDLERELDLLSRIDSVKSVNFIDDTFNVPLKRFKRILRMMIKKKYPFRWNAHYRCQFADEEAVALMKESGCEGVFMGLESGSDRILKNMNKNATVAQYERGLDLLKQFDIMTFGSFIVGFPGENAETVRESIQFIKETGLDFFRPQLWYCEPITPIWKKREVYGLKGSHYVWKHATMDWREAADWVDKMFLQIDETTWIPQYNFDFDNLFHLKYRGIDFTRTRRFFHAFNSGIRQKLLNPARKEVDARLINLIKQALQATKTDSMDERRFKRSATNSVDIVDRYGADFEF